MRLTNRRLTALSAAVVLVAGGVAGGVPAAFAQPAEQSREAAALSSAGTLLYVKGHNLWMARGDGSAQVQLTTDGTEGSPYSSPSMADNGRFAARKGTRFAVWERNGALAAEWVPPRLFTTPTHGSLVWENDPADPVLSPDGQRVAYTQSRAVNISGRLTAEVLSGFGGVGGGGLFEIVLASDPAWLTSSKAMLSRYSVGFHHVGSGTGREMTPWFAGEHLFGGSYSELSSPALSPDGGTVAVETGSGAELTFARTNGDPRTSDPAPPTVLCQVHEEGAPVPDGFLSHFDGVDFGPENDAAIYEQYGDTWRIDGIAACDGSTTLTKILPGAADADWSPVAYAPPSAQPGPQPGPQPPGAQPPGTKPPGATPPGASKPTIMLKGRVTLKGRARVGGTLKVKLKRTTPRKVSKKYTWFRNGKKIKGAKMPRLRLTRAHRGKKITVKVVLKAKGHQKRVVRSKPVRVRR